MRKLWRNLKPNHSVIFREQIADMREQTDDTEVKRRGTRARSGNSAEGGSPAELPRGRPQIPWWHLKIMTFANLRESWTSKTGTSGYDQQICPSSFHPHDRS